jgi:DNA-binding NtrC family response regulator
MWKSIRRLLGEPVRHDPLIELEDGLEVMERLAAEVGADCKTIIMTAHGEVRSAVGNSGEFRGHNTNFEGLLDVAGPDG